MGNLCKKSLMSMDIDGLGDFSFEGLECNVRVSSIYDGDTGRIVFMYKGDLIQYKFRLYGIDAPELKPRLDKENREIEKKNAIISRDYLKNMVMNKLLWCKFYKFDKYGRILVDLYLKKGGILVNKRMLEDKMAVEYKM